MWMYLLAAPLLVALVGERGNVVENARSASMACVPWTPSGTVSIPVGEQQTFVPSQTGCSGFTVTVSPADGTAGFPQGVEGCSVTPFTTGSTGLFKIRGCVTDGSVDVTVKDGQTVVQTITVVVT